MRVFVLSGLLAAFFFAGETQAECDPATQVEIQVTGITLIPGWQYTCGDFGSSCIETIVVLNAAAYVTDGELTNLDTNDVFEIESFGPTSSRTLQLSSSTNYRLRLWAVLGEEILDQSFQTGCLVPVEESRWGLIKRHYR